MIIQALCDYYKRKIAEPDSDMPRMGFSEEKISFVVNLRDDGAVASISDLRTNDKKPKPRPMLVPAVVPRSVNIAANFLWDNTGYVFGVDGKGKPERSAKTFAAFRKKHLDAAQHAKGKALMTLAAFVEKWRPEDFSTLGNNEALLDCNCVFMLDSDGTYVHNDPEALQIWLDMFNDGDEAEKGFCLVSGKEKPIARVHPSIKRVHGAQTAGAALVSFNLDAFTSYGKEQSLNAPISTADAFAYTTALNHLLRPESKQCIRIGDATVVFWAECPGSAEELPLLFLQGDEEGGEDGEEKQTEDESSGRAKVRKILIAVRDGGDIRDAVPDIRPETRFYILGLSPNAARISVRFWMETTFGEFVQRMADHADALAIEKQFKKQPDHIHIWQLLLETAAQRKAKNIPPNLSGQLMDSILTGRTYPATLYASALERTRVEKEISYFRAALVKACLVRNYDKEIPHMLDETRTDTPYLLGRLFALLEKAQKDAQGNINSTIRDRYFASATASPGVVFPNLLRLAQHHIAKADYGFAVDRKIAAVVDGINGFPARLSLPEQGVMIIGYYHQRNANYPKPDKGEAGGDEGETE